MDVPSATGPLKAVPLPSRTVVEIVGVFLLIVNGSQVCAVGVLEVGS